MFAAGEHDTAIQTMLSGLLEYQGVHGNHYQMMKLNLALMYLKDGNKDKADRLFDEIIKSAPDINLNE